MPTNGHNTYFVLKKDKMDNLVKASYGYVAILLMSTHIPYCVDLLSVYMS